MLPSYLQNVPSVPLTGREMWIIQLNIIPAILEELQNYEELGVPVEEVKGKKAIELFVTITRNLLVKAEYTNFQCRKYIWIILLKIINLRKGRSEKKSN